MTSCGIWAEGFCASRLLGLGILDYIFSSLIWSSESRSLGWLILKKFWPKGIQGMTVIVMGTRLEEQSQKAPEMTENSKADLGYATLEIRHLLL